MKNYQEIVNFVNKKNNVITVKEFKDRPKSLTEKIVLDQIYKARYVRLYVDSHTSEDPDGGIATAMVPIRQMNYARSAIPGLALTLPDGWRLAGLLTITTGTTSHPAALCRPDGWHTASPGIISMEPVK